VAGGVAHNVSKTNRTKQNVLPLLRTHQPQFGCHVDVALAVYNQTMKRILGLLLITFSSVLAQTTSFPPKIGETWRLEVDGLPAAIAKFTANSDAVPGAVGGDVEIGSFKGRSLLAANQGQHIIWWQSPDGVYSCVFASNPSIQGAKVQGLGAALERPGQQSVNLNKGCSATNITGSNTGTTNSSTPNNTTTPSNTAAKPDAPLVVPPEPRVPEKLEVGQNWRLSVAQNGNVLNGDSYNLRVVRAVNTLTVPNTLSSGTGWFEVKVDTIQRFTDFSRVPSAGALKLEGGVITAYLENNVSLLSCQANTRNLQGMRFVGGALALYGTNGSPHPALANTNCNLQHAGSNNSIPADAAAVLENAKRASGSAAAWSGLKNVGFRGESSGDVVRQTVTVVDFVGERLYKEYLQGSGSNQILTKKEWQLPAAGNRPKGTYIVQSSGGAVFANPETPDLDRLLYSDFWALRFGGNGWENATVEPVGNGMQLLTVGRKGFYTRFIISGGKYNGFQTPFSIYTLTVQPERLADAGGILAPLGTWKITSSSGQPFDSSLVEQLLRVAINLNVPPEVWEPK
jgi:hypothetical protein